MTLRLPDRGVAVELIAEDVLFVEVFAFTFRR